MELIWEVLTSGAWRAAPPFTDLEAEWLQLLPQAPDRRWMGLFLRHSPHFSALYSLTRSLSYSHFPGQKRNQSKKVTRVTHTWAVTLAVHGDHLSCAF